jgi:hypothetical protein
VFLLATANLIEAWQAWQDRSFLMSLGLPLPAGYWIAQGGVWAGAGLAATIALWTLKPWGRFLTLALVPVYLLRWLLENVVLGRSPAAEQSLPWDLAVLGVVAALVLAVLLDPKIADRFSGS